MSETPLPNVCGCSMPLSIYHHGRQSLQQLAEFVLVPHPSSFNTVMGTGRGVCVCLCVWSICGITAQPLLWGI